LPSFFGRIAESCDHIRIIYWNLSIKAATNDNSTLTTSTADMQHIFGFKNYSQKNDF
jgi:hypothetical protein